MGEPFGRWSNPPFRNEYDDNSPLQRANSFARPSGKSIYNQRKDYGQTLFQPQSEFQHHVEHLLTMRLEGDIRSTDDCLARLKVLETQGRVWGQNLILQVQDQELVLKDVESKEELEVYPLANVQKCSARVNGGHYNSVLAISVQDRNLPGTSVLLFQCERLGAETLKSSLEKLLKQWKEEQRSQYGHRSSLDMPPSLAPPYTPIPYAAPERWAEVPEPDFQAPPQRGLPPLDYSLPDTQQMPQTNPPSVTMSEVDRDVEVLNHVLDDLDLFVVQLKTALGLINTTDLKKKKKKKKKALPSPKEYVDFFQKVKYAFNLMGRTHQHMRDPSPTELLHIIFTTLSFVLDHCPDPHLALEVESPLLVPEAVELLEKTLQRDDYRTWKNLGMAWNQTRAQHPNGELVPGYIPIFSDGWMPPPLEQVQPRERGGQDIPLPPSVSPPRSLPPPFSAPPLQPPLTNQGNHPGQAPPFPTQGVVRALYEFQGRNPQELSVRMGDTLQVLDQRKKWWLVQNNLGQKGYIPSNILEPLGQGRGGGGGGDPSINQDSPPTLFPESSPAEVTAWLNYKGFSKITVRCLGVLTGHQLLHLSPAELRAICPEEWRRVLFKLSSVRTSLGMGPQE